MNEFGKKSKPKSDDITKRLAASLPSLAHNSCTRERGDDKKKRKLVHMDSQTASMIVEVDNSSMMSSSDSNSSFHSSFGSVFDAKNKVNEPLIEEPGPPDVNGNRRMSCKDNQTKRTSWHSNGNVSSGVGQGIFTESLPSSKYFPGCQQFSGSSGDDAMEERSPSESFDDDNEEIETIPMKILRRQWTFDGGEFPPVVTPRKCCSFGDLT